MTLLSEYLIYLNEDVETECRKKHAALKKKDPPLYRHQIASCIMWKTGAMLKPYDNKMSDLQYNYCKESEIKKRKGKLALMNPLAVRKCWKERDEKIAVLKRKSEHLRKKYWEYSRKARAAWEQVKATKNKRTK